MTAALIWIKAYVTPHVQYLTFTCQPAQVIGVPKLRFQSKLSYWTVCHLHEPIVGNLVLSLVMCIPLESIDSSCEDDIGIHAAEQKTTSERQSGTDRELKHDKLFIYVPPEPS